MAGFKLTNVITQAAADAISEALHGETYMDLQVLLCPAGGSWDVWVETEYFDKLDEDDEELSHETQTEELRDMVIEVMAQTIIKSGRE